MIFSSTRSARQCAERLHLTSKMGNVMTVFVDSLGKLWYYTMNYRRFSQTWNILGNVIICPYFTANEAWALYCYISSCSLLIFLCCCECWAVTSRDVLKVDALDQWCLQKLLGIKWYHHVWNDDMRWTTGQPHHTFWLLSKHGVSPFSATLRECQMKHIRYNTIESLAWTRKLSIQLYLAHIARKI